jgi:hypothetical protein
MMEKKRPIRTPKDLRGAAAHVDCEIEMLAYSGDELGGAHSLSVVTPAGDAKYMALESFLLHLRNLRAFLCPFLQQFVSIDDVCASDFLEEHKEIDLGNAGRLAVDQVRLNKMLAHFIFSRGKYIAAGEDGWKTARMVIIAREEMQVFFGHLSEERRGWFNSFSHIENNLATARWRAETDHRRKGS